MTRLIVLVVLAALAMGIAYLLQRRRPEAPSAPSYRAPTQVDRDDFAAPPADLLIAVFASTTCNTCPAVWATVEALKQPGVSAERIDVQDSPDRHKRYKIDGVPTTLVIDPEGVVQHSYFGLVDSDVLARAIDPEVDRG